MEGKLAWGGALATKVNRAKPIGIDYKLRNAKNVLPGLARGWIANALGMNHISSRLYATLIHANGERINYGLVSTRMITTAFCEYMVDNLQAEVAAWGDFKYHDSGTGVGAEAIGDTTMGTFSTEMVGDIRGVGTQIDGASAVQYRSVATITYDGAGGAITEHGLFNNTRAAGGTLMDRSVFAAINVVAADSIEFTFTLTCTAGG